MATILEYISKNKKVLNYGDEYPTFVIRKISPFCFIAENKNIPIPFQNTGQGRIKRDGIDKDDTEMVKTIILKSVISPQIIDGEVDYEKNENAISIYDIDKELFERLVNDILEFNGFQDKSDFFRNEE